MTALLQQIIAANSKPAFGIPYSMTDTEGHNGCLLQHCEISDIFYYHPVEYVRLRFRFRKQRHWQQCDAKVKLNETADMTKAVVD